MKNIDHGERSNALVVATSNQGKLREFRSMLPVTTRIVGLDDLMIESPEEIGKTFLDNALIKAQHATRESGLPALADDSGLEVEALNGLPGVQSARFAGPGADDNANNRKLIEELSRRPGGNRVASFVCAIAFSTPDGFQLTAEGRLSGRIIDEGRGQNGFGYDPHFVVEDPCAGCLNGQTLAEIDDESKNEISHRRMALNALIDKASTIEQPGAEIELILGA